MRILLATDFYSPFIGGVERQMALFAKELTLRGHQVIVVTVWHKGLAEKEDDEGTSIYRLKGFTTSIPWFSKDPKRRFHPPFPDPGIVLGLRALLKSFKPDIVHANGWIAYSCAMSILAKNIPMLISVRDYGYTCATRTLLHVDKICDGPAFAKCFRCASHTYDKAKSLGAVSGIFTGRILLSRKTTGIHSVSGFVQTVIQRDLFNKSWKEKIKRAPVSFPNVVIRSFISEIPTRETEQSVIREYTKRLPNQPYILFVGALQPHKGLGLLLSAYKSLVSPPPLVIIGTVWYNTPEEFPPGVTVLTNVPHPAVMEAWDRAMFGVVPSVWADPFPTVIREGMLKSKAVIATDVGGSVDLIKDGESGLLIPPNDLGALIKAMTRLIEDPELGERLGIKAHQQVKQFHPQIVMPQFEELYNQILQYSTIRSV